MHWLVITLTLLTSQPRAAERARSQANRRVRAERSAEVAARPLPGAGSSVQIPVTGTATDSAGRKFTFTGIVTLSVEEPALPTISQIRSSGGAAQVTEAISGTQLELWGAALPTTGTLRLQVAGKIASVQQWTAGIVFFTAPTVTTTMTGPVEVYQSVNGTWQLVARGPTFTLKTGFAEVPVLPRVDAFLGADGTPKQTFALNEPLILSGVGFGDHPGRVLVNWLENPVLSWSETRIQTTAGETGSPAGMRMLLEIKTPSGWLGPVRGPVVTLP